MALTTSQVVLYAADPGDMAYALGAAAASGIPLGNVLGNFESAWQYVSSGNYLVIAVGGPANNALYYNPCGWANPAGEAGGSTPFDLAPAPRDTLPGTDAYISAAGTTGMQSLYLATAYAAYAVTGSYPTEWNSPPSVVSPSDTCSGSNSVGCPCSSCSYPATPPSGCTSSQVTFINQYLSWAKVASANTGLPVSFVLAHWGLETGWGTGGGLCDSCNNPGNLGTSGCGCAPVGAYSSLSDGVSAYINAMNSNYPFVKWAYDHYGLKEACMAIGAGCEPGSGYSPDIYATGRYNGVTCGGVAVDNNCYLATTIAGNGQAYSTCAPTVANKDCDGCNGCGYVGCSLYETATSTCLSSYDCVE